jgi:AAA15 family ATPase/GTPase
MYQSFGIKNYRCFDDFKVDGLSRINLFAGKNDVGKTTLLEALFIHSGAYNANLPVIVNTFRGLNQFEIKSTNKETSLNLLFKDFNTEKSIEFISKNNENQTKKTTFSLIDKPDEMNQVVTSFFQNKQQIDSNFSTMDITQLFQLKNEEINSKTVMGPNNSITNYLLINSKGISQLPPNPPPFETVFISSTNPTYFKEELERFGKIVTLKKKDQLIKILQVIEPKIKDIQQTNLGGTPIIEVDIGLPRFIPIAVMGQGLSRLLNFILCLMDAKNGIVLIDEIENGIYFENLPVIWKHLANVAETFNVQIFATTHSLECINAAFQGIPSKKNTIFNYIRLDRKNGQIIPTTYDKASFDSTVDLGLDVR